MRLFLVRHGETVDNVAGIYAGTRDSPLTTHGVLQARRLAAHLAARSLSAPAAAGSSGIGTVRQVFSSDLRRAVETAQAVVDALAGHKSASVVLSSSASDVEADDGGVNEPATSDKRLCVVQCPELRERDFGLAEGKKFGAVAPGGLAKLGAETREQMRVRAERFARDSLAPVLSEPGGAVVVVAHGLILDALLRVLLALFSSAELARLGDERTVGWSNTGYVELLVRVDAGLASVPASVDGQEAEAVDESDAAASGDRTPPQQSPPRISLSVVGVNVLKHLEGLRKTRGGIGSAQFDKRQRTVDSFFAPAAKKTRIELQSEEA